MDRRTFLGTMGVAAFAVRHLTAASIARVGVQLYTVRTDLEKDFEGTLGKIAALGYKEVEFAGYFNHTPKQVNDILKKTGLTSPSSHIGYAVMSNADQWKSAVADAHAMGQTFIINPWIEEALRNQPDIWKKIADTMNRAGEVSKKAGIQLAYHNHNFEFVPVAGKLPYDTLLEQCDPSLVKMEMDLCWVTVAGQDPIAYFKKYPGRFPMVHVKGLAKGPAPIGAAVPTDSVIPDITDVGSGGDTIDWKRILAQSSLAGIKHYFVEHDMPKVPMDSLKASISYLQKLQF